MASGNEVDRTRSRSLKVGLPGVFELSFGGEKRWTERARTLGERVSDLTGMAAEEIEAAVEQNETVADVTYLVTERVAKSSDEEYREALARALAVLFGDDSKVDEVAYLCAELGKLEPLHLRGLRAFTGTYPNGSVAIMGPRSSASGMTSRNVARRAGVQRQVATSILSRLEAAGLVERHLLEVRSNVTPLPGGEFELDDDDLDVTLPDRWSLSDWGVHVIRTVIETTA